MECYTDDRSDLVILGCTGLGMSVSPQFVLLVVERAGGQFRNGNIGWSEVISHALVPVLGYILRHSDDIS